MRLKLITSVVVNAQLVKASHFQFVYFSQKKNIFYYLNLGIALAIPASNDEKLETNNSPLNLDNFKYCF